MDPKINQPIVTPQVPNVNVQPPQMPQAPQAPQVPPFQAEQVVKSKPRNKKVILLGGLFGLLTVVVVGAAGFYMLNSSKQNENENVAVVPTPTPVVSTDEEEVDVAQVSEVSDLDSLLVGLAQADEGLDQELTQLEKDSDF